MSFLSSFGQSFRKFDAGFTFGLFLILVQAFILINCKAIFGTALVGGIPAYEYWRTIIMVYLVMLVLVFALPDLRSKLFNMGFLKGFIGLAGGLVVAYLLFSLIGSFVFDKSFGVLFSSISPTLIPAVLIQAFIVGACENLIFVGFLAEKIGVFFASVIFALFHWAVYFSASGGGWLSMFVVFALNFLFFWVYQKWGMPASIGVHAGWNIFVTISAMAMMGAGV